MMNRFVYATIFLVACLTKFCICLNSKFVACASRSCSTNGQQISYPFYIKGVQESYCGMDGFEVNCGINGEILYSGNPSNTYRIDKIDYVKQHVRVVNARLLDFRDNCDSPMRNLTLMGVRFDFVPNQTDRLYFYSCSNSSISETLASYQFPCSADSNAKSFVALFGDEFTHLGEATRECERAVWTTVDRAGSGGTFNGSTVGGIWDYYEEVLERGFWLQWKATNCTECTASGGRCGFDEEDYRFWCYCPDRPHVRWCRSGNKKSVSFTVLLIV